MVRIVRCPAFAREVFTPRQLSGRESWMDIGGGIYSERKRKRRQPRYLSMSCTIDDHPLPPRRVTVGKTCSR